MWLNAWQIDLLQSPVRTASLGLQRAEEEIIYMESSDKLIFSVFLEADGI